MDFAIQILMWSTGLLVIVGMLLHINECYKD